MKVYGGGLGGTYYACIAAASKAEAVRLIKEQYARNFSMHYFNGYWSVTGYKEAVALALSEPGVLFMRSNRGRELSNPWIKAKGRE